MPYQNISAFSQISPVGKAQIMAYKEEICRFAQSAPGVDTVFQIVGRVEINPYHKGQSLQSPFQMLRILHIHAVKQVSHPHSMIEVAEHFPLACQDSVRTAGQAFPRFVPAECAGNDFKGLIAFALKQQAGQLIGLTADWNKGWLRPLFCLTLPVRMDLRSGFIFRSLPEQMETPFQYRGFYPVIPDMV